MSHYQYWNDVFIAKLNGWEGKMTYIKSAHISCQSSDQCETSRTCFYFRTEEFFFFRWKIRVIPILTYEYVHHHCYSSEIVFLIYMFESNMTRVDVNQMILRWQRHLLHFRMIHGQRLTNVKHLRWFT